MENRRKKLIAKIKIAQQQLGLDDDTYRDMLEGTVGKRSAAQMTDKELTVVIEVMKSKGFQDRASDHEADKPDVTEAKKALVGKIEALLADGNKPWRYAEAMAERMFNRKRIQWLSTDQLHRLVAALQINANRAKEKS
ncbi:regulatory protein GemA [Vitreoscilla massiliensis]|uniref:Regulatory protein GemA n=1 Tax=Vitreoscilla massiliensis TaxID=1689272 RepID=A0ABY4E2Y0_9NEIS|nr:regulatory protein GemA [Vitreoscilla massiliensis]UOO89614.1 regulatory protein GemA [Vitreoscilla massiliensis]